MLDAVRKEIAKFLAEQTVRFFLNLLMPFFSAIPGAGVGGFLPNYKPSVGYAKGTNFVPENQVAYLHKGEMVVPANEAEAIRNGSSIGTDNNLLANISSKLDGIAMLAKEKGTLVIGEEELRVMTKAINNTNYEMAYMGI